MPIAQPLPEARLYPAADHAKHEPPASGRAEALPRREVLHKHDGPSFNGEKFVVSYRHQ